MYKNAWQEFTLIRCSNMWILPIFWNSTFMLVKKEINWIFPTLLRFLELMSMIMTPPCPSESGESFDSPSSPPPLLTKLQFEPGSISVGSPRVGVTVALAAAGVVESGTTECNFTDTSGPSGQPEEFGGGTVEVIIESSSSPSASSRLSARARPRESCFDIFC